MRLRHVCTLGVILCCALGGFATSAFGEVPMQPSVAGGATAPASTGPSGTTGATGASGATGTIGSTGPEGTEGAPPQALPTPSITAPLAPIVLPKGESPNYVYAGPVYVQTATGAIVPYAPHTVFAAVAGGVPSSSATGGLPRLLVPGNTAEIINGLGAAPENAPPAVRQIIWNANKIIGRPYEYGGGHASFTSYGYDCSGTVSFALHGGHLLGAPLDSSQFMGWGRAGQGRWMTILTNPEHAFLDIAGLRLDTSAADDPNNQQGPRWRPLRTSNPGYSTRHPASY